MSQLPNNITALIFDYIDDELTYYWKSYFTKFIVINIDPKSYFTHNVLSEINKGWKEVSIFSAPCLNCFHNGYKINNTNCINCLDFTPCLNCYWYNDNIYNYKDNIYNPRCKCKGKKQLVSWNDIQFYYPKYKKYRRYYDLINSQEWFDHLELEYIYSNI